MSSLFSLLRHLLRPLLRPLLRQGLGLLLTVLAMVTAEVAGAQSPPAPPAAEAQTQGQGWYAATVAKDQGGGFLMVHFWSKGPLMRSEAVLGGRRIITIVDRERYAIIDGVSGTGISIARSPHAIAQDAGRERPFGNEVAAILAQGGEKVAVDAIGGTTFDVYRITDSRGRRKVWATQGPRQVPIRIETFDRQTSSSGEIEYVNWLYGIDIPDGFFDALPNWKLERMSYEQYRRKRIAGPVGPAPVLYSHLLHGESE